MSVPDYLIYGEVEAWNKWRKQNRSERPDLKKLNGYLGSTNLTGVDLNNCFLQGMDFAATILNYANFEGAFLHKAYLSGSSLIGANLKGANIREAFLVGADFRSANLWEADLEKSILIKVDFRDANLTDCKVYGTSAWDLKLDGAIMNNILITPSRESIPAITVDNFEIAQFAYLLLNSQQAKQEHLLKIIEDLRTSL